MHRLDCLIIFITTWQDDWKKLSGSKVRNACTDGVHTAVVDCCTTLIPTYTCTNLQLSEKDKTWLKERKRGSLYQGWMA